MYVTDPRKIKLLEKHRYWEKGIPCYQYKMEDPNDVKDVLDIDNAYRKRDKAIQTINEEMSKL